ncbi:MAG: hypothetical protein M1834_002299 [Cirrosporium novae-zelandiae]|nr:MAG: hypothetical protein M1834_002299 [Cirrosporium novae-zelandiae]
MVGLAELPLPPLPPPPAPPAATPQPPIERGFSVGHQRVELDIDFATRSLRGSTDITILPHSKDLKHVRLNCRQCKLTRLTVNNKAQNSEYKEPYRNLKLHFQSSIHQYHILAKKAENFKQPPEGELVINLSKNVRIDELDPEVLPDAPGLVNGVTRKNSDDANAGDGLQTPRPVEQVARFSPVEVHIEFSITDIRDGLHFVGLEDGDSRYPHAYSRHSPSGSACSIFPCVDDFASRHTWEFQIRCARTLGDAFSHRREHGTSSNAIHSTSNSVHGPLTNGNHAHGRGHTSHGKHIIHKNFSPEDAALEMMVICSGDMTDEIVDETDPSKVKASFQCTTPVAPQHIGFAVGPFEHVNLSEFRESDEDDHLGQNAIPVHGYCLPGRAEEVRNTCIPMAKAIDFITIEYGSYPFSSYKMCFVDDLTTDVFNTAALSIFSNHLLFPEEIIDPIDNVTWVLVCALATQWIGVNIPPDEARDFWLVMGLPGFIAGSFIKKLCGNNEYRYRQKKVADEVCELDVNRPSLHELGPILSIDPSEARFMAIKAPLVLFILDRRLVKASGHAGLNRIITRLFLNAKVGKDLPNGAISTAYFQRLCERFGHAKLDTFFQQWVYGAGCPRFEVTQRFNKKKLVVEMLIVQKQGVSADPKDLEKDNFIRDVKEELNTVYAGPVQPVFAGPMTIRIHEADGTPYEHIVEIREATTKFEIPYNTKYKRLKRSRRQKERAAAASGVDFSTEGHDDVLLYSLGDVLQSEDEIAAWQLSDWSKEDEERMSQESYEWIRMDADFEWICRMAFGMPGYMYASQLQQDRDVVAQLESVHYIGRQRKQPPIIPTLLVRTLMDRRYFHGIRTTAAELLANSAREELNWMGLNLLEKAFQELFCFTDSPMTRSNDFSDRSSYRIQCAIIKAISKVRDNSGRAPLRVKRFLLDKLKFNDNSDNEFSDCYYVTTILNALTDSFLSKTENTGYDFNYDEEEESDGALLRSCLEELERYRRMDEWLPSFQNIYARTALGCKKRLAQAGRIKVTAADFLQYTREGTFDLLRLDAFRELTDMGSLKHGNIMQWFLWVLSHDPSPFVRQVMHRLLGLGLASIAFGEGMQSDEAPPQSGLIIEQESTTTARQEQLSRKQTITGAMAALKVELSNNLTMKKSFWEATTSPAIGIEEVRDLLVICRVLYDTVDRMMITMNLPRYWKVESLGRGKLKFSRSDHIRTKLIPKFERKQLLPSLSRRDSGSGGATGPRLTLKPPKTKMPTSSTPGPGPSVRIPSEGKPLKLKLKVGSRPLH